MKNILSAMLLFASLSVHAGNIEVENPYVRHLPPTQKVTGAFMRLKNENNTDIAVVGVSTEIADRAELHVHEHDNGVMRMRQVNKISIPANDQVELKPGGYHIMLIGLKEPLKLDKNIELQLTFDDRTTKVIQAPVKKIMSAMQTAQ